MDVKISQKYFQKKYQLEKYQRKIERILNIKLSFILKTLNLHTFFFNFFQQKVFYIFKASIAYALYTIKINL